MAEVHILNGSTEFDEDFEEDVLRGTIDQDCLRYLGIDRSYQREEGFSPTLLANICEAYFQKLKVPDIVLGMRGTRYRVVDQDGKKEFFLIDKVFVIDGGQRVAAARTALAKKPSLRIQLGAKIFLETSQPSENRMFGIMNATQQRVSASVLIRNQKTSPGAMALFALNSNEEFALNGQIGWDQKLGPGEVLNGFQLSCIAGALHEHVGGVANGAHYYVLDSLDKAGSKITAAVFGQNVLKFFDMVDDCWPIREFKKPKPDCLQVLFLTGLAKLLSGYPDFWDAQEFYMPPRYQKRLVKVDVAGIRDTIRQMKRNNVGTKDAIFQILMKRLQLDPMRVRKPPPKPDKRTEARL